MNRNEKVQQAMRQVVKAGQLQKDAGACLSAARDICLEIGEDEIAENISTVLRAIGDAYAMGTSGLSELC